MRHNRCPLGVLYRSSYYPTFAVLTLALCHAENGCLMGIFAWTPAWGAAPMPAVVGFIGFDGARQGRIIVVLEHRADFVEHPPCRLVGDSQRAFKLLGRDAAAGLRHEIDDMKPEPERGAGFVEDSACCRVNVMTTPLTRIRLASGVAVIFSGLATL